MENDMTDALTRIIEYNLMKWVMEDQEPTLVVHNIYQDCLKHFSKSGYLIPGHLELDFVDGLIEEIREVSFNKLHKIFPKLDIHHEVHVFNASKVKK